jgi:hypothetical protein
MRRNTLKTEVKKLWVDALRSGEYKQGQSRLRDGDTFCCLGVLCDLYRKDQGKRWYKHPILGLTMNGEEAYLPLAVREWAGIEVQSPEAGPYPLSVHNDTGIRFPEIADLIEKYL